ncbi:MAG: uroporphyrinogen decarboxylase family protein [Verrucomicrobia bacterium]|nr:uroporphyrinogen decarboxylase family protein [Verrucomicrobiota bacterium]MBU1735985.1 uroporphyrinogen decarboxylase family protein [Verrucomicrobiota bacterium]MBU1857597.1 uroporphyrinogen decarboxylase family protein [Verrucomicrobiota bacterium]
MAKNAGISLKSTHFDIDAILKVYDAIKPFAEELGVDVPKPRLAGFGYPHVVSLGAPVEFPEDGEPNVFPLIHTPEEIDHLKEPDDYLAAPLIQQRLKISKELVKRRSDAVPNFIGHSLEGPITTAVLLMGQDFLTLPYDDPKRAHRLLNFCTESALHYIAALHRHCYGNAPVEPGPRGIPDDFAGMLPPEIFGEFVVPYWNRIYDGLKSTERHLHSELLREKHMPFLRDLKITFYDPSADQYVTPELLKRSCPCRFMSRIQSWDLRDLTAEQLEKLYQKIAESKPYVIAFSMDDVNRREKIKRLLKLAREMEK